MDAKIVFECLALPVAPLGNGDLLVIGEREQVRRVPLYGTDLQVKDAARDQTTSPWLVTKHELFLFSDDGARELRFPTERFGQVLSSGSFVPSMVEAPRVDRGGRLFALNTRNGAYVFQLVGDRLEVLHDEPIDFIACASVSAAGSTAFVGACRRPARGNDSYAPGVPTLLRVEHSNASRPRVRAPVEVLAIGPQVLERLMAPPHNIAERHIAAQAVPEVIAAAVADRFLVTLTALPNPLDPVDELAMICPIISETIGLALVSAQGQVLDVALYVDCLGVWSEPGGAPTAVLIANRGHGGRVEQLSSFALEPGCASLAGALKLQVVGGIDDLCCHEFEPRHHEAIGNFGVAHVAEKNRTGRGVLLIDRGAQRWEVVSDEETRPAALAPV